METKQTEEPDLFELTNINVQLLRQDMLLLAHAVDQVVLISHQIERTIELSEEEIEAGALGGQQDDLFHFRS